MITLGCYIGSGTGIAHRAGVIDGNVEPTETRDNLIDEVFDLLFMRQIGAYKFGLSPEIAQFSG